MIGGIVIDIDSIKNNDALQLQQIIIFLKSEVAKHKNEIAMLKNRNHFSMVDHLEHEISQLNAEKKELSLELLKIKKQFEKEWNDLHENIQVRENQRIKLISSIEALVEKKVALQKENKKLIKELEGMRSKPIPAKSYSTEQVETIDTILREFIKKNSVQLSTMNKQFEKSKNELTEFNQSLLTEIKNQSEKIDFLIAENKELKQRSNTKSNQSVTLSQIDQQIQKLLNQAGSFESQLDEKLRILDDLEYEIFVLANEIKNK